MMKYTATKSYLAVLFLLCCFPTLHSQTVIDVNPGLFLEDGVNVIISTVSCTLSDGSTTNCYEITTTGTPADHAQGPWCPDNISDGEEAGGIWIEGGEVYDVDGAFIENMATFYNDNTWLMYDSNGDIYKTETETDCINAANPNVGAEYENFCVECLPSYVLGISQSYLIPITPITADNPYSFGGGGGPGGPGAAGPTVRGLAFNGVRFDATAPTDAILSAYTIAPFDDAGGHINFNAGYHYHAATGESLEISQCDAHAPMIGYALDGYGIYSQVNEDGNEPTDLDDCRGHYDDIRGYHYHVDAAGNNNFINCLHGAYVAESGATVNIDADGDGYFLGDDCDDNNASINPGATEIANNDIDENCDGSDLCACVDSDLDGACAEDDCDDTDATIFPGATEICNDLDENCDGQIDEGLAFDTYYLDNDGDGFGDAANSISACRLLSGYAASSLDCDDNNAGISPGQTEILYNGIDDDCNASTLDDDIDQDGFAFANDCDDTNASINPNAIDIPGNGIDEDCDGVDATLAIDNDNDGFDSTVDCDDNNAAVNPNATEIPYNGIDEDCNPQTLDDDLDQDGFAFADDCDDNNASINPNATDIPSNGIDEDCDGMDTTLIVDNDNDGFDNTIDCDDNNAAVNPDAVEVPYNSIDDDCNPATLDDDLDQDGFASANDCDDANADVNPDATEIAYNSIDDDCNPETIDDDLDQDGFLFADDCDDNDPNINPDAADIPNNDIDEDCDGADTTSSVHELANTAVNIYPNPATAVINITTDGPLNFGTKLYDLEGKLITASVNSDLINVESIPTGLYLLELIDLNSGQKIIERIIIEN